jgi:hypothetical protein
MMLAGYEEMKNSPVTPAEAKRKALSRVLDLYTTWDKTAPGTRPDSWRSGARS